jgi:mono/diheme cytochrome c family protein
MTQIPRRFWRARPTLRLTLVVLLWALPAAAQDPARRAPEVYEKWCTPCHGAGDNKPGTISAGALYKGSKPAVLAERSDLTPAGIRSAVRTGMYIMPRFRKTEVSDAELDTIVAFLTRTQPVK